MDLNNYQKKEKLGKGLNDIVYKVLDIIENKFYALKIIDSKKDYEKEIEVMKNIKNDYIIKIKDNFFVR